MNERAQCWHDQRHAAEVDAEHCRRYCPDCGLSEVVERCAAFRKSDGHRCLWQPVDETGLCEIHGPHHRHCTETRVDGQPCGGFGLRRFGGVCIAHAKAAYEKRDPAIAEARAARADDMRRRIVEAVAASRGAGLNVSRLRSTVTGKASTIAQVAEQLVSVNVLAVRNDRLRKVFTLGPGASNFMQQW